MKNRQLLIKYLAAIGLSLFCSFIPKQVKAQSTETTEVEGCSLEFTESEIKINNVSADIGCNFKYKLRDQTTEYSVVFNIIPDNQLSDFEAKESSVYVLDSDSGKYYEQKVGTSNTVQSLTVSLKNLYDRNQASLVIEDRMSGNGSCGAGDLDIIVYDQNLPNKLYRLSDGILKGGSQDGSFSQCTEFQDVDNNGIPEIVTVDNRFYYAFGEPPGEYSDPPQIITLAPDGFEDVTLQYPNFLRTEAKHSWDEVITKRQEVSDSCPGYFAEMGNYAAIKSMLGEYPDAIKRIKERINMDLSFHRLYDCYNPSVPDGINTFIPDLEAVLSEKGYI